MAQHGGEHGGDLEVYQVVVADVDVVFEHFDDRHRDESLQEVEREDGQRGPAAQHAEQVGRAGVLRAVLAAVDAVVFLADPHGARNRAQQIGYDNHGGSGVVCQYHLLFAQGFTCKYTKKFRNRTSGGKNRPCGEGFSGEYCYLCADQFRKLPSRRKPPAAAARSPGRPI